jgi:ribosome-associated protein
MIVLPDSDKDLLEQCDVETFRSSGKGGQHVNKTESAVRLRHRESGLVVISRQERSQHRNKAICLARLRRKIEALNYRPPSRVKTNEPKAVKRKVLESKVRHSRKKSLRAKVLIEED